MAEFTVDEGLVAGLRDRADQQRNQQRLAVLQGLLPTEQRLRQLPTPLWPLDPLELDLDDILDFPHPQFMWCGKQLLLASEQALYRISDSWVPTLSALYGADAPTVESANDFNPSTDWTPGAGWTISETANTATHASGTATLAQQAVNQAVALVAGKLYRVRITISSYSGGTVTPSLGAAAGTAISGIGVHNQYILCSGSTPAITLTPTTSFVATISSISVMEVASITPTAGGGVWRHASFGEDIWFMTNGQSLIYSLPSEGGVRVAQTRLLTNAVANANNRLVFGGMSGTHFSTAQWLEVMEKWRISGDSDYRRSVTTIKNQALDGSWFAYSQASGGAVDFPFVIFMAMFGYPSVAHYEGLREPIDTALEQADMGLFPLKNGGTILAAKNLGLDTIFYTTKGISRINWTETGPMEVDVVPTGVAGRGAMAGDDKVHVWCSKQGTLHRWQLGEGVEDLDKREFISTLEAANIVIDFDPIDRYFSITDGKKGFWLSRTGLGGSDDVMPTSLLRFPGAAEPYDGLLGAADIAVTPGAAVVETDIFDAGERGTWEITKVGLATTDTDASGWTVTVLWRMNKGESFTAAAPVTVDDRGVAFVKAPGIEWKVRLEHPDRTKCDLDRIEIFFRNTATGKISVGNVWDRI